jgi:hypothetical protein
MMAGSTQICTQITAHLIGSAFFFLLRVGEYTRSQEKRQTIPFRKKDIWLWRSSTILPNNALLEVLRTANTITMCLNNKKMARRTPFCITCHWEMPPLTWSHPLQSSFMHYRIYHQTHPWFVP